MSSPSKTLSSSPNCVESVSCPDTNWLSYNQNCYLLVNGEFGQSHSAATTFCQELEDNCGLLWLDSLDEKAWVGSQSWDLRAQRGSCKNCGLMDAAWVALYREQQAPYDFYWRRGNGPPVKDDILGDIGPDHTGTDHTGTDHTGTDHTGTDHTGSNHNGTNHNGTNDNGTDHTGANDNGTDHTGADDNGTDHTGTNHTGTDHTGTDHT
uniref:C-type lectin domain-containing protein n=1 Tax=Macrostomum lignano TaxID=282301 RepID=A0A1I8HDN6_9PLAT